MKVPLRILFWLQLFVFAAMVAGIIGWMQGGK